MKISKNNLNINDFNKFFNLILNKDRKKSLNIDWRKQCDRCHYVYMKLVKGDKIEYSLTKVNNCQHELTKFRETQADFNSKLTNLRFALNILVSHMHEAKRLENDELYLKFIKQERELKRTEQLTQIDYNIAERKEQSLKDALAIAREELHINQRVQVDYLKHLGVIFTIGGLIMYFIRFQYDSKNIAVNQEKHFTETRLFIRTELNSLIQNFGGSKVDSNNSGFIYNFKYYTGINHISSWFWNTGNNCDQNPNCTKSDLIQKSHNKKDNDNETKKGEMATKDNTPNINTHGYTYYLGKYTGANYLASCIWHRNTDSEENSQSNHGYIYYLAKYSGITYASTWITGNSKSRNDAD